jgi:POT family proton-dependent oligopeptide transporter
MSLFLFTSAFGSIINIALVPVSEDPNILWMYAALEIQEFLFDVAFLFVFRNDHKVHVEQSTTK